MQHREMRTRFVNLRDPFAEFRLRHRTEEGGEGGGGGGNGGGGPEEEEESSEEEEEGEPQGKGKKGKSKPEDDFPWDDYNRLRRETADRSRKDREREQEEARKRGEHEKIAQQEKERADAAEAEAKKLKQEKVVTRVAGRKKMKDPTDAPLYLSDEEMEDEASAERALDRLEERKPHLFDRTRKTGGNEINEEEEHEERETSRTSGNGDEPYGLERLRSVKRKT
jgi:hypothetical protein